MAVTEPPWGIALWLLSSRHDMSALHSGGDKIGCGSAIQKTASYFLYYARLALSLHCVTQISGMVEKQNKFIAFVKRHPIIVNLVLVVVRLLKLQQLQALLLQ